MHQLKGSVTVTGQRLTFAVVEEGDAVPILGQVRKFVPCSLEELACVKSLDENRFRNVPTTSNLALSQVVLRVVGRWQTPCKCK